MPRWAPSTHLAFLFTCQPHITSPDNPPLLIWPLPQLHSHITGQTNSKSLSGFSFHLPTTHCNPRWAINTCLGLLFTLSPLTTHLLPHTSPDEPQLLVWPLSQLLHPPFAHHSQMSSKCLSGFSFHLPTTHHKPRWASMARLGLQLILPPHPSQPSPFIYYLTQAQMSHNCSSGLFLSSIIFHLPITARQAPTACLAFLFTCQPHITSPDEP